MFIKIIGWSGQLKTGPFYQGRPDVRTIEWNRGEPFQPLTILYLSVITIFKLELKWGIEWSYFMFLIVCLKMYIFFFISRFLTCYVWYSSLNSLKSSTAGASTLHSSDKVIIFYKFLLICSLFYCKLEYILVIHNNNYNI